MKSLLNQYPNRTLAIACAFILVVGVLVAHAIQSSNKEADDAEARNGCYLKDCRIVAEAVEPYYNRDNLSGTLFWQYPTGELRPSNGRYYDYLAECVDFGLLTPEVALELKRRNEARPDPIVYARAVSRPLNLGPGHVLRVDLVRCSDERARIQREEERNNAVVKLTGARSAGCAQYPGGTSPVRELTDVGPGIFNCP